MPKVKIPDRADLSANLPVTKDSPENNPWGRWQVKPVAVERRMSRLLSTEMSAPGNTAIHRESAVSFDSGIGSITSIGALDISHEDGKAIGKALELFYQGLFAGGAQVENLPKVRKALMCTGALLDVLARYGLQDYGEGIVESGIQILEWSEKTPAPEVPHSLVKSIRRCDKLRAKSNQLTRKADQKKTPENVSKAIQKNKELDQFKWDQLKPAELAFDHELYSLIDQQPMTQELQSCLQSLKARLPEHVEVVAPIDTRLRTWAYNVLLERAKNAAGVG